MSTRLVDAAFGLVRRFDWCCTFSIARNSLTNNDQKTYYKSDGYVKIPNNRCQGGVQHGSTEPCPEQDGAPAGSNGGMIALAVILVGLVIAAVIGVGIYVYLRRKKQAHSYASYVDQDVE